VRSDVQAKHGNQNTRTTVVGSTQDYFPVRSLTIEEGRAFNDGEIERRARVAVLGADVRDELFGGATAIGRTVKVNGQSFAVVGVTKRVGSTMYGNRDDQITVPVTTAMKRLFRVDYIRSISAQAVSEERMRDAEEEVHAVIRESRRLSDDEPSPVRIHNQADLTESASEQSTFLTMLLGGIAVVSLVVGGIGIMNIMLVSVTERTREIGIRKAIGAKRRDVLYQFLLESVTLSLAGGALGVALGIGVATWFGRPESEGGLGYPMLLDMAPIVVSFGFSAFVGVFFGIYPAIKASALDPIEALRYE
jgi:putative ABC transport system permease protein